MAKHTVAMPLFYAQVQSINANHSQIDFRTSDKDEPNKRNRKEEHRGSNPFELWKRSRTIRAIEW